MSAFCWFSRNGNGHKEIQTERLSYRDARMHLKKVRVGPMFQRLVTEKKQTKVEPKKDSNKKSNEEEERNFRAMTLVPCTLGSNMNRQRAGSSAIPGQCTYDDYVVYA